MRDRGKRDAQAQPLRIKWRFRDGVDYNGCHLLYSVTVATFSLKGGDPAAGSPTATLLRLHPNHESYLGPLPPLRVGVQTSSTIHFRDVTGGVYKARERIHGIVLICHY